MPNHIDVPVPRPPIIYWPNKSQSKRVYNRDWLKQQVWNAMNLPHLLVIYSNKTHLNSICTQEPNDDKILEENSYPNSIYISRVFFPEFSSPPWLNTSNIFCKSGRLYHNWSYQSVSSPGATSQHAGKTGSENCGNQRPSGWGWNCSRGEEGYRLHTFLLSSPFLKTSVWVKAVFLACLIPEVG